MLKDMKPLLMVTAALCCVLGSARAYTVQPGDTLYSIARKSGTTVQELQRLNALPSSDIKVGQQLRLPGEKPAAPVPMPMPSAPTPSLPTPAATLSGVSIVAPSALKMGDAFVLRLSGTRAAQATVRFISEVGEDVRQPAEPLRPIGAAGEYVVLGRVVLGKTTPLVYEITLDGNQMRGSIPVKPLTQRVQYLNLPRSVSKRLEDPGKKAEDTAVNNAYTLRTPQVWSKPFQPAVAVKAQSSSFGQPRTYVAGGPVLYHYGTDYAARVGTAVTAVNDGTVVMAGNYPVRGGLVVIDHGAGVASLYFHQSKVSVKVGQKVLRGQKVGEVGSTGLSSGPHLHLEIRVRGEATDPALWMNRIWPK